MSRDEIKRAILKWIGKCYGSQEMENPSYNIEALSDYLYFRGCTEKEQPRICSECGKEMTEGYCIENGTEYYCSDNCLHKHYTDEEYNELYDDGNGDSYWTTWEIE